MGLSNLDEIPARDRVVHPRAWFWPIYGLILMAALWGGVELVSSFMVPSYPARELRPVSAESVRQALARAFVDDPALIPNYNDWGMRDRARSFDRPASVKLRSVIVGDSFVEGFFVSAPLPERMERQWAARGRTDIEAINFGVLGTNPEHYYYRIRDIVLALKPDVIVVVVYAGNDFITNALGGPGELPWIAERPLPSLLGTVAPRTTWLAVNRLGLSEVGQGAPRTPNELALLNDWVQRPPTERLDLISRYVHDYYQPGVALDTIREILSRGDGRFWTAFGKRPIDREYLPGWLPSGMVNWETGTWEMARDMAHADRTAGMIKVRETLSWLAGAERLAKARGVRLVVALAPTGVVDPRYVDYWRPWPNYYSFSLDADARHRRLAEALREKRMEFVDLREALWGRPGMYRLSDGHWTEQGTAFVADILAQAVEASR